MLFLDAADEVLVRRFEGTRHRHPLAGTLIEGSIHRERELLEPIRAQADIVLDTSDLNENELRQRIAQLFSGGATTMQTSMVSFGYKHGLPLDGDVVLDVRFLPNPHWEPELSPLTGLDQPVRDYVVDREETKRIRRAGSTTCCGSFSRTSWPRASRTWPSPSAAPAASTAPWSSSRSWPTGSGRKAITSASSTGTSSGEPSVVRTDGAVLTGPC